jgi:prepilin-type N-terminal cleavage/methylation domain-containing protein
VARAAPRRLKRRRASAEIHLVRTPRVRPGGFTLIEMMVVVVILGILAALASFGWRRYIARARTTEATWMLAEIATREELYKSEFAQYLPLRIDSHATFASGTVDETGSNFYPLDPSNASSPFDSSRMAVPIGNGGSGDCANSAITTAAAAAACFPRQWKQVGLKPRANNLYCVYSANAGTSGVTVGATVGAKVMGAAAQPVDWFYALGVCSQNNPNVGASWETGNTVFAISSKSSTVAALNDGQ